MSDRACLNCGGTGLDNHAPCPPCKGRGFHSDMSDPLYQSHQHLLVQPDDPAWIEYGKAMVPKSMTMKEQIDAVARAECHRIVCVCGIESWCGDKYHHVTSGHLFPCSCGRRERRITCPQGCTRRHPQLVPKTSWDHILDPHVLDETE